MDTNQIAIRGTTQDHLDIEDIKDDLVILKDGSCCLIIATTAINFELLSEREQEATIYAYAGLLNSLTFAIQITIRSQRKDISSYVRLLEAAEQKEAKPEIKVQIQRYRRFVEEIVQKNEVLDKKAYVVIPMSALELGVTKSLTAPFRSQKKLPFEKDYILEKAKMNLYPKRDHLIRLLARLGLKGRQLTTQELIQLFFTIYNPEATGQQAGGSDQYHAPLVQTPPEGFVFTQKTTLTTPQPTPVIPTPAPPGTSQHLTSPDISPGGSVSPGTSQPPAPPGTNQPLASPVQALTGFSEPVAGVPKSEPGSPASTGTSPSARLASTQSGPSRNGSLSRKEDTLQSQIGDLVKEAVASPDSSIQGGLGTPQRPSQGGLASPGTSQHPAPPGTSQPLASPGASQPLASPGASQPLASLSSSDSNRPNDNSRQ